MDDEDEIDRAVTWFVTHMRMRALCWQMEAIRRKWNGESLDGNEMDEIKVR
jgi:hypothetical protein